MSLDTKLEIRANSFFISSSPCMYKGKILCNDCARYKECDMKEGREVHRSMFISGFKHGVKKYEGGW